MKRRTKRRTNELSIGHTCVYICGVTLDITKRTRTRNKGRILLLHGVFHLVLEETY